MIQISPSLSIIQPVSYSGQGKKKKKNRFDCSRASENGSLVVQWASEISPCSLVS